MLSRTAFRSAILIVFEYLQADAVDSAVCASRNEPLSVSNDRTVEQESTPRIEYSIANGSLGIIYLLGVHQSLWMLSSHSSSVCSHIRLCVVHKSILLGIIYAVKLTVCAAVGSRQSMGMSLDRG
jgi:hypothetical protein